MTTATERPDAAHEGLIVRHPLVFFIIAYAFSWLVALPYVRFADGSGLLPFSWPIPFIPVAVAIIPFAGPFLAGFIMAGVTEGRAGIGRWLRKIVLWRVGFRWYLFALSAGAQHSLQLHQRQHVQRRVPQHIAGRVGVPAAGRRPLKRCAVIVDNPGGSIQNVTQHGVSLTRGNERASASSGCGATVNAAPWPLKLPRSAVHGTSAPAFHQYGSL